MPDSNMVKYKWGTASPIYSMVVEDTPLKKRRVNVRLYANTNLEDGSLANLPAILHKYGFSGSYADVKDDKNTLVIPDIKQDKLHALFKLLDREEVTKGEPAISSIQHMDETPEKGLIGKIKDDTLKWSGRIGLIGHGAMFVTGAIQNDKDRMKGAALGPLNPLILSIYGNGKDRIDFDRIVDHMRDYFEAEGITLPELDDPSRRKTFLQNLNKLVSEHPLQIGHTLGSLGAVSVMQSGLKERAHGRLAAGTTSLLGNMSVVLVPEKRKTKQEKEKTPMEGLKDWWNNLPDTLSWATQNPTQVPEAFFDFVRASPLRFNGILNFTDNIFYGWDAAFEHSKIKKYRTKNNDLIAQAQAEYNAHHDTIMDLNTQRDAALANLDKGLYSTEAEYTAAQKEIAQSFRQKTQAVINEKSPLFKNEFKRKVAKSHLLEEIEKFENQLTIAESEWKAPAIPALTAVTAVSFTIATFLSAISSKNRSVDKANDQAYEKLYAMAAKLLSQMPRNEREDALHRMSVFLSAQDDLKDGDITSEHLEEKVRERIAQMEHSPWVAKVQNGHGHANGNGNGNGKEENAKHTASLLHTHDMSQEQNGATLH